LVRKGFFLQARSASERAASAGPLACASGLCGKDSSYKPEAQARGPQARAPLLALRACAERILLTSPKRKREGRKRGPPCLRFGLVRKGFFLQARSASERAASAGP